jgi:hypothetical protein
MMLRFTKDQSKIISQSVRQKASEKSGAFFVFMAV